MTSLLVKVYCKTQRNSIGWNSELFLGGNPVRDPNLSWILAMPTVSARLVG